MPYIKPEERQKFLVWLAEMPQMHTPGEVAYVITRIIQRWVNEPSYLQFANVTGILETVKLEFYRRKVAPYEDMKCKLNGDVF